MPDLRYEAPGNLADAVRMLAAAGGPTRILAGGTDVIVQMETDLIEPELLVDIKKIPGLHTITSENGGFRIGSAVSAMKMMDHAALCATHPGIIEGVKLIGSIQVKGREKEVDLIELVWQSATEELTSITAPIAAPAPAPIRPPDTARSPVL